MHIEHVALWTGQLEELRAFYTTYLGATSNAKYVNAGKQFESYFLAFPGGGARLELMRKPEVKARSAEGQALYAGYVHLAVSAGSQEQVDALTSRLRRDGFVVVEAPHTTGDGYYESSVLDPDGNRIEITI